MARISVPGLHGVDLASFQGSPAHWSTIAGPISWAAVKITEHKSDGSTYVNPDAAADWAYLAEHNLGRIGYLFAHPGSSAQASATAFVAEMERLGVHDGDGVCLDLEVTDGLPPARVSAWAQDVTGLISRALSRPCIVYTFLSFAEAGNCAGLGHWPLWMADPSSPPGHPRVPAPWKSWAIHQYSISGGIDRDIASWDDLPAMRGDLGKRQPQPHKPGPDRVLAAAARVWLEGEQPKDGGDRAFASALRSWFTEKGYPAA